MLDGDGWRAVDAAVEAIRSRWREPDAGVWELDPEEWTHSRLICAAGLRAIAAHRSAGRPRMPTATRRHQANVVADLQDAFKFRLIQARAGNIVLRYIVLRHT
jgi:hypothetical protein